MDKEKRILSYFLGWLIVGFCIIFVGVNDVFALNVNSEYVKIFDNYGTSLTEVTTAKITSPKTYWTGTIPKIIANSNGGAIIIQTESPLAKGVNYSLSINLNVCSSNGSDCYNIALSSKFNLGIGTGIQNTKDSYFNNTGTEVLSKEKTGSYIYYNFTTKTNGSYILVPFSTETSCNNGCIVEYYGYDLISNGLASDLSASDITNITNSQTNELNNSIQNSTDTITGEIDDMEQSIIDSNKETQDVIKDQFNSCRPSNNLFNTGNIWSQGQPTYNSSDYTFTFHRDSGVDYLIPYGRLELKANTNYIMYLDISENTMDKNFSLVNSGFLDNGDLIIYPGETGVKKFVLKTKTEATTYDLWFYCASTGYLKAKIMLVEGTNVSNFEPYGEEVCSNKIDETNDQLGNINDALTDSSAPNTSGLENSAGWLPPGPLDSILNLPLTMLNSLTNSLGNTCSPLNLTLPYINKNIQIPCLSAIFAQITGVNSLWSWVGTIASVLILYNYLLNLYAWVDRVLTLRAEFDEAMGADLANWGRL